MRLDSNADSKSSNNTYLNRDQIVTLNEEGQKILLFNLIKIIKKFKIFEYLFHIVSKASNISYNPYFHSNIQLFGHHFFNFFGHVVIFLARKKLQWFRVWEMWGLCDWLLFIKLTCGVDSNRLMSNGRFNFRINFSISSKSNFLSNIIKVIFNAVYFNQH